MSPTLLTHRLTELELANIIITVPNDKIRGKVYQLTSSGKELFPILDQLGIWAQNWLHHKIISQENLNPDSLMWEIRQSITSHNFCFEKRKIAQFRLSGVPEKKQFYWLIFEGANVDICVTDPGHDVDIWITAEIRLLVDIWLGHIKLNTALRNGTLKLDGYADEVKAFSSWFFLSHFATTALIKEKSS